jgi:hypothetical protein
VYSAVYSVQLSISTELSIPQTKGRPGDV